MSKRGSKSLKNVQSLLLDNDENQTLFNILGHGCSVSTIVVSALSYIYQG